MKYNRLPVLCVNSKDQGNVAYELLTISGFTGVGRCEATPAALMEALYASSPLVIVAEFDTDLSVHTLLSEIHSIVPGSALIMLFDKSHEPVARSEGTLAEATYVSKDCLWTLATVVRRELQKTHDSRDETVQSTRIAQMNRALHLLNGINGLVPRFRDREGLLREACHLLASVGGYDAAIASSRMPAMPVLQPIAWSSGDEDGTEALRVYIARADRHQDDVIGRVMRTAREFVWTDADASHTDQAFHALMQRAGFRAAIALPHVAGNTCVGVLVVASREAITVDEEELRMLRAVAGVLTHAVEHMQSDIRVRFLSHYDPQTGLAKRDLFKDRLAALLEKSQAAGSRRAVVVMDVERLSLINASLGRRAGDQLLRHLATRLRRLWPHNDEIAHFGGGTFAWTIDVGHCNDAQSVGIAHQPVKLIFADPLQVDVKHMPVTIRTGFVLSPDDGRDADELIRNAEVALSNARGAGERHLRYDAERHSRQIGRWNLEHQLRRAIVQHEFELHYQPKLDIVTRRLSGLEALLRWRQPDGHLIASSEFLPVLESSGLIVEVGRWVIQQAAGDCRRWLKQGLPPVRVAVNIAPAQLREPAFISDFLSTVAPWATRQSGLDVEITEGVFQEESPGDVQKLNNLRQHGTKIAIDDFGTGYSSLSRIARLPVDVLKIDRSFISQLNSGHAGGALVKTVIGFARAFDMLTVAEGVETQGQLDTLWHLGCDQSQGFLHSPAVCASECAGMLRKFGVSPARVEGQTTAASVPQRGTRSSAVH